MPTSSLVLIIGVALFVLVLIWIVISNLRHAAGMRARDSHIIDKTRIANKQGRNRIILSIGRAGKPHSLFALLHHIGRKSGTQYSTPVRLIHRDNAFTIPLTYGERSDWYKNLKATGTMQITWQGQTYDVGKPERLEVSQAIDDFPWISRFLFKQEGLPGFLRVTIV